MKPDAEISILRKEVNELKEEIKDLKRQLNLFERKDIDLAWR
jgi:hypothetical protein